MDDLEKIGSRIRAVREGLNLNQAEFAEKLGLSGPSAVSKYEKAQNEPNIAMLTKISKLGNKSLDWLLTGKEPPGAAPPEVAPYPPEVQRYVDKLAAILTGPDQKLAGKLEERIDIMYEEIRAEDGRVKKGA